MADSLASPRFTRSCPRRGYRYRRCGRTDAASQLQFGDYVLLSRVNSSRTLRERPMHERGIAGWRRAVVAAGGLIQDDVAVTPFCDVKNRNRPVRVHRARGGIAVSAQAERHRLARCAAGCVYFEGSDRDGLAGRSDLESALRSE